MHTHNIHYKSGYSTSLMLKILSLLLGISYFSIYFLDSLVPVVNLIAVFLSYYIIIKYNSILPVLFLICSARSINGFTLQNNDLAYKLFSVLTFYLPFLIYAIRNLNKTRYYSIFKYKYTLMFCILTIIYFIFNIDIAHPLLTKQVLPIFIFVIYLLLFSRKTNIDIENLFFFFRILLIVSLVVYFIPGYLEKTLKLYLSGNVFGVNEDNPFISYFDIIRNQGICFDGRIWGIFIYLYFYLMLSFKKRVKWFDFILISFNIISTVSRGAILVFIALLILYLMKKYSCKFILVGLSILFVFLLVGKKISSDIENPIYQLASTFNLGNENNALSQRSIFSEYSLKYFKENPLLGNGLGELTANGTKQRNIYSDSRVTYNVVSDAFLFSILGEMGILGFLLLILSYKELIINKKNIYSYVLFIMFLIHLSGTDIPNMYMFYFVILLLLQLPNKESIETIQI